MLAIKYFQKKPRVFLFVGISIFVLTAIGVPLIVHFCSSRISSDSSSGTTTTETTEVKSTSQTITTTSLITKPTTFIPDTPSPTPSHHTTKTKPDPDQSRLPTAGKPFPDLTTDHAELKIISQLLEKNLQNALQQVIQEQKPLKKDMLLEILKKHINIMGEELSKTDL